MSPEEWHPMATLQPTQAYVQHLQCALQPLTYTRIPGSNHLQGLTGSHKACWVAPMGILEFHYWNVLRKREKNMFPYRTVHKSQRSLSVPTATSDSVHILCTEVWVIQRGSPHTHAYCTDWIKGAESWFFKGWGKYPHITVVAGEGPQSVLRVTPFLNTKETSRAFWMHRKLVWRDKILNHLQRESEHWRLFTLL